MWFCGNKGSEKAKLK